MHRPIVYSFQNNDISDAYTGYVQYTIWRNSILYFCLTLMAASYMFTLKSKEEVV